MKLVLAILKTMVTMLLALLFFAVLLASLLLLVSKNQLLHQDFYKEQLRKNNVYERIYTEVLPEVGDIPRFYGNIQVTSQEAQGLIAQIIPASWLQSQVEGNLDSFLPWLRSDTDQLSVVVDLQPIKQKAPGVIFRFVDQKIDSLPPGPPGTPPNLAGLSEGRFPEFIPSDIDRAQIKGEFRKQASGFISSALDQAPNRFDLIDQMRGDTPREQFLSDLDQVRENIRNATQWGLPVMFVIAAFILGLMALVQWGNRRARWRWVGGTLFLSGLFIAIAILVLLTVGTGRIQDQIQKQVTEWSPGLTRLVSDVALSAVKDVSATLLIPSAIVFAIGFVFLVLSFFVGPARSPKGAGRGTRKERRRA